MKRILSAIVVCVAATGPAQGDSSTPSSPSGNKRWEVRCAARLEQARSALAEREPLFRQLTIRARTLRGVGQEVRAELSAGIGRVGLLVQMCAPRYCTDEQPW